MMNQMEVDDNSADFDMQLIGNFLSFASRGDRVGLNQMLRAGTSPNVQDYDKRTALHLAASEGHAPIVELLLHYKANVNLKDRWQRTVSSPSPCSCLSTSFYFYWVWDAVLGIEFLIYIFFYLNNLTNWNFQDFWHLDVHFHFQSELNRLYKSSSSGRLIY